MFRFLAKHATAHIALLAVAFPFWFTEVARGQGEFGHLNNFQLSSSQSHLSNSHLSTSHLSNSQPFWGQRHSGNGTLFDQAAEFAPAFANNQASSVLYGQETAPAACQAGGRYSLRTFGGWNFFGGDQEFNRGWALGGAAGRAIRPNTRVEMEFTYRHNAGDQSSGVVGNLNSYSLLSNLLVELPALQVIGLTPYVGGGVGLSLINGSFEDNQVPIAVDDPAFAYQGIVGVGRKIGKRAEIFAEYRYFGTTNVDFNDPTSIQRSGYSAENVLIGLQLRY
jgi:opacity protein-like surface antigen